MILLTNNYSYLSTKPSYIPTAHMFQFKEYRIEYTWYIRPCDNPIQMMGTTRKWYCGVVANGHDSKHDYSNDKVV